MFTHCIYLHKLPSSSDRPFSLSFVRKSRSKIKLTLVKTMFPRVATNKMINMVLQKEAEETKDRNRLGTIQEASLCSQGRPLNSDTTKDANKGAPIKVTTLCAMSHVKARRPNVLANPVNS